MPACPTIIMNAFMGLLRAKNPTIDRGLTSSVFGKSSLQPLVALLRTQACTPLAIYRAIAALPPASVVKYEIGLSYLLRNFPGLNGLGIQVLDLKTQPIKQTEAALYEKTPLPPNYKPTNLQKDGVFMQPPSAFMGMSIVQYLLANPGGAGVLLIHLGSADSEGLEEQFNGRTTLQYMTSVLRVARVLDCPVAALSMATDNQPPLCIALLAEFMQVPQGQRVVIHEPKNHTATNQQAMRDFLQRRPRLIVMGFDATICVFANVFGSDEQDNNVYRPPLINFTDIIMSRATLACTGNLYAKTQSLGKAEYGPLFYLAPN